MKPFDIAVTGLDKKIKQAVRTWGERDYEGIRNPVFRRLLGFWFSEEHILPGGHIVTNEHVISGINTVIPANEVANRKKWYQRGSGSTKPKIELQGHEQQK